MTAYEVFESALKLLGYTDDNGNERLVARVKNRALELVNVVYGDLCFEHNGDVFVPVTSLSDDVNLSAKALAVMPFGIASFIAQSESDGDQQQIWATMYNRKRKGLGTISVRKDTIPVIKE